MDIIRIIVVPLVLVNSLVVVRQIQSLHNTIVRYSSYYYHDNTAFRKKYHAAPTPKTTEAGLPYSKHLFDIHSCLAMDTCCIAAMDRNYHPTTKLNQPLTCPCSKSSAKSQIAPYERVVRTTWPSGYDVDKLIISVSHTLNIQCLIAFSTDIKL